MRLRVSEFKGISFGLVSAVITTIGMITGLDAGTHSSKTIVLAIVTLAFADGLSDALGVHVSEESSVKSPKRVWRTTFAAFGAKFIFTLSFLVPLLLFRLHIATIVSIVYGLLLIGVISYFIAEKQGENKASVIREHTLIAVGVIIISYLIGNLLSI